VLGDTTRPGLTPVAVTGFALAVASAVMLARFGEAEHDPPAAASAGQIPRQGHPARQPGDPRTAPGGAPR
ncbi:MAG TPA: hypothetical protein VHF26_07380, partial [Trebonia sp.]|nr:hypothetical protein [Trebonia sp.]